MGAGTVFKKSKPAPTPYGLLYIYNVVPALAFDGQEKGFGVSTKSIGHLARDLASVLIENGSDVKA